MYNIESKIKENRTFFDDLEPKEGHEQRFSRRLKQAQSEERKKLHIFQWHRLLKVAVVVFILIVPSAILFENHYANGASEYPAEYIQARQYYQRMVDVKEQKVASITVTDSVTLRIKNEAIMEVAEMKKNISMLENDYKETSLDDRLFTALISNYRMMSEMLDHVFIELDNKQMKRR